MTRKFRGLTKEGKWVYGWYWCNEEAGDFHKGKHFIRSMNFQPAEFDYTDYEVIPATVGQSTGLSDKNGREGVYAKDIIKAIDPIALERGDESEYIGVVAWSNRSLAWVLENKDGKFIEMLCRAEQVEVIGNQAENPELLAEGKE